MAFVRVDPSQLKFDAPQLPQTPTGFVPVDPTKIQFDAPQTNEAPGLLSRIGSDINNRWQQGQQAADDYVGGKISYPELLLASTGKVIAGSGNDIAGEVMGALTPDIVKQGLASGANATAGALDNTSVGQGIGNTLLGAKTAYDNFTQNNPRAARNIESAANIATFVPTAAGAVKTAAAIPDALSSAGNAIAPIEAASEKLPGVLGDVSSGAQKTAQLTPDMLQTAATMRYDNAAQLGGMIKPGGFQDTLNAIKQKVGYQTPEGIAFAGEGPVTDTINKLDKMQEMPISLKGLDEIDGTLNSKISVAMRAGDNEAASKLIDIKNMLKNASNTVKPEDLVNPQAFEEWRAGDSLWSAKSKMQQLQNIVDNAYNTDNPDTAIRAGYRTLSKQLAKNPQGWTPQEIALINQGAKRGVAASALKAVSGRLMSHMTALALGAAGTAAGGIPGAMLGFAAGEAAGFPMRALGNALQESRAAAPMAAVAARPAVLNALPTEISEIVKLPPSQARAAFLALKNRP